LNPDFLHKIHFLSTSGTYTQFTNSQVNVLSEDSYTLSTKLNPNFNLNLTFSTNLNELNSNSHLLSHDPMLGETVTTNLNNIAKQQRWLTKNF
jgi:hypothetical protein